MDRQPSISDFTEGDRLLMEQALEDMSGDVTLAVQANTSTLTNFRHAFESAALNAILTRVEGRDEITDQFRANPERRRMMVAAMMEDFYHRVRSQPLPQPLTSPLPTAIEEHAIVSLNTSLLAEGKILPKGARGTVVAVYRDGAAYEVEFFEPFHCVKTVMPEAIVH